MKICFIHNSYGQQVTSGAQRIVKNLVDYLASHNHEVVVIACGQKNIIETKQIGSTKIIYLPSDFYNFSIWPSWRRLISHVLGFFNLGAYLRMSKIMKQEKFDLVWTHNLVGFGLIVARAIKAKTKLHTCHDIQLLYPSGLIFYKEENILLTPSARVYRFFCKLVFAKDTFIIFPSTCLKDLFKKLNLFKNNQQMVLANPLVEIKNNTEIIKPANFTFLYLGQLEKHKGVDLLISAFEKISDVGCRLLVAGEGALFNELQKINDSRISFLGNVENPTEIISKVNCVVVPSLCYENLPTVILEAMQANTPVIGSNFGGIKELLSSEKLLFIPTEEGIRASLEWCLLNQEELKNVALKARQRVKVPTIDFYLQSIGQLTKAIY